MSDLTPAQKRAMRYVDQHRVYVRPDGHAEIVDLARGVDRRTVKALVDAGLAKYEGVECGKLIRVVQS